MGMVITGKLSYLLKLDGRLAGRSFTFTGGGAEAEVVVEKVGRGEEMSFSAGVAAIK